MKSSKGVKSTAGMLEAEAVDESVICSHQSDRCLRLRRCWCFLAHVTVVRSVERRFLVENAEGSSRSFNCVLFSSFRVRLYFVQSTLRLVH